MKLTPGSRLRSAVCNTEIIVVRLGNEELDLHCGGVPMVPIGSKPPAGLVLNVAFGEGTKLGKRYTDASGDLELLCTKPGGGSLSLGDELLVLRDAKPLPSSD